MVERRIPNPMVAGSNPPWPATHFLLMMLASFIRWKCPKDTIKMKNTLSQTIQNAKMELAKVIFPTKPQVKQAFIAVIAVVTFVVLFLALVDFIMSSTVSAILS